MTDDKPEKVFVEGTQFYKKSPITQVMKSALIIFVCFVLLAALALWAAADAGARQAYKEARDIRRALRIVGTEYYGEMSSIYDPSNVNGMVDGADVRIAEISTRNGEVILYSWDDTTNTPLQFEYRKGLYRVIYTNISAQGGLDAEVEGDFRVYYSFELLKFEGE